jgi:hypothetical protein
VVVCLRYSGVQIICYFNGDAMKGGMCMA